MAVSSLSVVGINPGVESIKKIFINNTIDFYRINQSTINIKQCIIMTINRLVIHSIYPQFISINLTITICYFI